MGSGSAIRKLGSKPMNWIEDRVSGGSGTSKTLLSKVADPMRQNRQHNQAGGGTKPADMLDPNGQLHKIDSPATIQENAMLEATAPQRAAIAAENAAASAANNSLILRKRRRQSGLGQLATGATSGGAQLSTANAYGKSTFGG